MVPYINPASEFTLRSIFILCPLYREVYICLVTVRYGI